MLIYRILTAVVLIPLVIILLFWASFPLFVLILMAICGLAAWEWTQFLHLKTLQSKSLFVVATILVLAFFYVVPLSPDAKTRLFTSILTLSIVWWLVALLLVISYPNTNKYWHYSISAKLLFAFFTLVPFFIGMIKLRAISYDTNTYIGAMWLLYVFVLVWATDIGAYFAGRSFGKYKLAPKVSPGKTIEGFIGGVAIAIVISVIVYCSKIFSIGFNAFIISSLLAILASVLGDLTESMFKREAGIKDSGRLIPGHGGILDRIDSLTAAIPVFAALSMHLLK
ncbi:phosphatidate cytidylyltransferase [Orbaceae bacterium ESL0727]|nr:phosphatidate cytidylyltransferase [Orbaceae bacterium ESL0727]